MYSNVNSVVVLIVSLVLTGPAVAHEIPRLQDGKPDLNGIWQSLGAAYWNIEPHAAYEGSTAAGAFGAARPGIGIVTSGRIPYLPDARAVQKGHFAQRADLDPALKCYLPGVPRANYMPYPLQIVQGVNDIFIAYEFAQASRTIYMDSPGLEAPVDTWMGHSIGSWQGDTLHVTVTDQVGDTWLDRAGNHHSGDLEVKETWTLISPDHLKYRATMNDPAVYESPWTLEVVLYRDIRPNAQLLEFKCIEFVEELMYGHLSREARSSEKQEKE